MSEDVPHKNHHGTEGTFYHWRGHLIFIPAICQRCASFHKGSSYEDDPPDCAYHVWYPARTGTCKRYRAKGE